MDSLHRLEPERNRPAEAWQTRPASNVLPPEILLLIFKMLYVESRNPLSLWFHDDCESESTCSCYTEPWITEWEKDDDLTSPSLFPYAISSVCKLWEDVTTMVPEFWTRIIVFVDDNPTPLSKLRSYLQSSKEYPLRVFVMRRPNPSVTSDPLEQARVAAVVDIVMPHLHRFESLSFELIHSSSLPSISRNFHGTAPKLESLTMMSSVYDARPAEGPQDVENLDPFFCPAIRKLKLVGCAFADACINRAWVRQLRRRSLDLFYIAHLTSSDNEAWELFDFLVILSRIRYIAHLELIHIDLPISPSPVYTARALQLRTNSLYLEDLTSDVITAFYSATSALHGLESQTITRSKIKGCKIPFSYYLTLEGIQHGDELASFLQRVDTGELYIYNSPGFNDSVLDVLGSLDEFRTLYVPSLRGLTVRNCTQFSTEGLMKVITFRREDAASRGVDDDDDWDDMPPIQSLYIGGSGPGASEEQKKWFRDNVKCFSWRCSPVKMP